MANEKNHSARLVEPNSKTASAADVRSASQIRIILPGMELAVIIRRPSTTALAAKGRLPSSLATQTATKRTYDLTTDGIEAAVKAEEADEAARSPEQVVKIASFILDQVCESFVEPRCVREVKYPEREICPEDLPIKAQEFMVEFVQGEVDVRGGKIVHAAGF